MKKVVGVLGLIFIPTVALGFVLYLWSGDWLFSFSVWPIALAFAAFLWAVAWVMFKFLRWAFDD